MEIVPLYEKNAKLCFRDSGDVVTLPEDGSGPWIVTSPFNTKLEAGNASQGTYRHQIDSVMLVHLETGVMKRVSLSTRVVHYPKAAVHTNKAAE